MLTFAEVAERLAGRLGHPTDLDLALARQRPAGEPDSGTPTFKQAAEHATTQKHEMRDMAAITGTACAAFMVLALDETGTRSGAFAPEDWADPRAFYKALERVGTPNTEIVESVV
jgi:hypothetical protein